MRLRMADIDYFTFFRLLVGGMMNYKSSRYHLLNAIG
ncbi:MAG: hypothetical protein XD72_0819 [Methanothrix harundinacea]|uniref:Uncharacterized protein n=1 Tax=Methanothrix harundinacea TaxID=301375 RepID=A0A101IKQ2_9EURY|nr:MAG: hypothetical protein XD72_0819 [Methanothrix harundinacea]KUK96853.1 MAG: hypothetical protein XE07_0804 [Methanothrix harundinacea]